MYIPLNEDTKKKKSIPLKDPAVKTKIDLIKNPQGDLGNENVNMDLTEEIEILHRRLEAQIQLNQVLWGRLMEKESEIINLKTTLNMQ